ncbi:uncharacterized protein EDB91DRAFT_1151021 [Suillus paluster]|uniref:uncharacterized protein n=1 Tax=Suillus paluster TaxID=48578 RepID=UPI001B86583D|nr:uncharacterized protein EDB91DRAFT_1151021 [Suillus paluster]KAG1732909.1 hypothetical protein EDB91DRAFT_1151021 [Suillus paluster]
MPLSILHGLLFFFLGQVKARPSVFTNIPTGLIQVVSLLVAGAYYWPTTPALVLVLVVFDRRIVIWLGCITIYDG